MGLRDVPIGTNHEKWNGRKYHRGGLLSAAISISDIYQNLWGKTCSEEFDRERSISNIGLTWRTSIDILIEVTRRIMLQSWDLKIKTSVFFVKEWGMTLSKKSSVWAGRVGT